MAKIYFTKKGFYDGPEPIEIEMDHFDPTNVLLANIESVKKESYLDDNVSSENIRVAMLYVQDAIIERITGSCLMNQLKVLIFNGLIDDPCFVWYRRLLDEYLFQTIVNGIQADLAPHLTFKERNQGVIRNNDPSLQYPILNEVKYIKANYEKRMNFYINRSVKWLKCNKKCFRELCGCYGCCECETAPFNKPYSFGMNLDIVYNNNKAFRG